VINLVGLPLQDRPSFFLSLLPTLHELRTKTGRPHWILVDETHHLMPRDGNPTALSFAKELVGMIYVTVHPDQISPSVLQTVNLLFALGRAPQDTIKTYCNATSQPPPALMDTELKPGQAMMWNRTSGNSTLVLDIAPSSIERHRHRRKYAEGELPPERSFYFKGPAGQLNLRAQNLLLFMQMGEGVDDATWLHHLTAHDYSAWITEAIKDEALAQVVREVETNSNQQAAESRRLIRTAIEERYTVPSGGDGHAS
jgi:hypothetical protein